MSFICEIIMQYITADNTIAFIREEGRTGVHNRRLDDQVLFWDSKSVDSAMVRIIVDAILNDVTTPAVDPIPSHQFKIGCMERLADLQLIDLLIVHNSPYSYVIHKDDKTNLDHYRRNTQITVKPIIAGKTTQAFYLDGRCHLNEDSLSHSTLEKVKDKISALPHLKEMGLLDEYTIFELPWVNNFEFTQPSGMNPPEDYLKLYDHVNLP